MGNTIKLPMTVQFNGESSLSSLIQQELFEPVVLVGAPNTGKTMALAALVLRMAIGKGMNVLVVDREGSLRKRIEDAYAQMDEALSTAAERNINFVLKITDDDYDDIDAIVLDNVMQCFTDKPDFNFINRMAYTHDVFCTMMFDQPDIKSSRRYNVGIADGVVNIVDIK